MGHATIATRVTRLLEQQVREVMREEGVDKSTAVRRLLELGALEWRRSRALELYRQKRVSLWRAAELSGLSLREMLECVKKEGLPIHVSVEDIEEDIAAARKAEAQ